MPASDTFKRAARRSLERIGVTATITNYAEGTTDKHGDPEKVQDSQTTGVPALFRRSGTVADAEESLPVGTDASAAVLVWLPSDQDVRAAGDPDANDDPTTFPTRITNEATGRDFDVIDTWDEQNDQQRVLTEEV